MQGSGLDGGPNHPLGAIRGRHKRAWLTGWRLLVPVSAIVIVLAGGVAYVDEYKHDWESKSWPTTSGRIIRSEATSPLRDEGWDLDVSYEYEVDTQSYTSRRVSFGWLWRNVDPADFADSHPPGTEVAVYYHPINPATSVLFPRAGIEGLVGTLGGWLLLLSLTALLGSVATSVWRALRRDGST
jgi:hypothetical protein